STPLHVAARWGQSEVIKGLLSHEALKFFIKDMLLVQLEKFGLPLHEAARCGKREALQALLTAGTAQNCLQEMLLMQDTEGKTPLSIAQYQHHQHQHRPSGTSQEILSIFSQFEATLSKQVAPVIKEEVISNLANALVEHHSTPPISDSVTANSRKRAADTDLGAQREAQRLCTGAASDSLSSQKHYSLTL
ncbi:MAG: hypothetical protein CMF51_05425, partial [Legionellales bacterium]|nr:hypothetical protein [Legionellales bacterium]